MMNTGWLGFWIPPRRQLTTDDVSTLKLALHEYTVAERRKDKLVSLTIQLYKEDQWIGSSRQQQSVQLSML